MLGEVVREAAGRFGDTPAFVRENGDFLTYAELDRLSAEVACGLSRRGVGPGDVVSLMLHSGPAYLIAYAAAAKVGAITAGVNERLTPTEQVACLSVAHPALVIADDAGAEAVAGAPFEVVRIDSDAAVADLLGELRVAGGEPPALEPDLERPVAIVFTSGTTGLPKGAVFCGRQLEAIGEADAGSRWGGGGRGLGSTSMAHLATMTKLPQTIRGGGTTFLMERWSAADALKMVERHGITTLGGIPTQVALMLRHESFGSTDVSSVRVIALGGGPSVPALIREARERFGVPVLVRYTCTEAGVGTGTGIDDPPEDAEESVGRARGAVEVTIRPPIDDLLVNESPINESTVESDLLPQGEIGEVCLRSPAVMSGYYEDPIATQAVLTADGAVRTGDLGWLDERGRLRLCGRSKEMYVRGGYNVFPLEVESVLCEHPAIAHVAVVPRQDPVMGEIGVAVVVVREGFTQPSLDELRNYAQSRLGHHKLPEDLLVVDELPRTAMEKIDRRELKKLVSPGSQLLS